jgi:hypothetical protein
MRIRVPVNRRVRRVLLVIGLVVAAFVLYALVTLYVAA